MVDLESLDLDRALTLQLATTDSSRPWIATVYFVHHQGKLFWLSYPERRHSQEINNQPSVAAAIVLKASQPVKGLQVAGEASVVEDGQLVEEVMDKYFQKYNQGKNFSKLFQQNKNRHQLYRLIPTDIQLFDES